MVLLENVAVSAPAGLSITTPTRLPTVTTDKSAPAIRRKRVETIPMTAEPPPVPPLLGAVLYR